MQNQARWHYSERNENNISIVQSTFLGVMLLSDVSAKTEPQPKLIQPMRLIQALWSINYN